MHAVSIIRTLAAALVAGFGFASAAEAATQKRVALVIGNSGYQNIAELTNPINDANDIAQRLRDLSFDVILGTNLTRDQMQAAFSEFAEKSKGGDSSVFFYAGHGISLAGENFLIPVDMPSEIQVESEAASKQALDGKLVNVAEVTRALQASKVGIIFLDACRNTPSKEELGLQIVSADGATRKYRSIQYYRGISQLPAKSSSGAAGIFRAYATAPDSVSDDGEGRNSPFTKSLLKHLGTPNLDLSTMMMRVRNEVKTETEGRQHPWDENALTDLYYFNEDQRTKAPAEALVAGVPPNLNPPMNLPSSPSVTVPVPDQEEGQAPQGGSPSQGQGQSSGQGGKTKKAMFPSTLPKKKHKAAAASGKAGLSRRASSGGGRSASRLPPGVGFGVGAGL